MYPDQYNGLNLKPKDLTGYDSPLLGFDGKVVVPKDHIRLPVQARSEVVEVDFIMVDAYSPYTTIIVRPWLHALGIVSSTLHLKVKYPFGTRLKSWLGANPWLGNAWRLQLCISLKMSPQPLLRWAYNNQGSQCHLQMRCWKGQVVRNQKRLLLVTIRRSFLGQSSIAPLRQERADGVPQEKY